VSSPLYITVNSRFTADSTLYMTAGREGFAAIGIAPDGLPSHIPTDIDLVGPTHKLPYLPIFISEK
jgi:hypothetical protein